jgi:hypothetical protein
MSAAPQPARSRWLTAAKIALTVAIALVAIPVALLMFFGGIQKDRR